MAADGLAWTLALIRYLAAPAIASGGSYTFATPSPFSSVPMPARIVHGTPYCCPTFLYQNRKFDGIDLALGPAGGCPAVPVCCPEQPALAAKNAFVPTRMGTASRPRPTMASSPMMPTTRIRGARCCLAELGWVVSVRIRSLFVMTAP